MGYYDETAKGYNELHKEEQLKKLRIISDNINVKKTDKLLDVGCGSGLSAKIFNCSITGVDPSTELLKQCSFKTIKAKAEKLPFSDNEFDIVIAVTCIHNFDDIKKALNEIKRVGKKKFVLTVLKKSEKKDFIINEIKDIFMITKIIEEDKDIIIFSE